MEVSLERSSLSGLTNFLGAFAIVLHSSGGSSSGSSGSTGRGEGRSGSGASGHMQQEPGVHGTHGGGGRDHAAGQAAAGGAADTIMAMAEGTRMGHAATAAAAHAGVGHADATQHSPPQQYPSTARPMRALHPPALEAAGAAQIRLLAGGVAGGGSLKKLVIDSYVRTGVKVPSALAQLLPKLQIYCPHVRLGSDHGLERECRERGDGCAEGVGRKRCCVGKDWWEGDEVAGIACRGCRGTVWASAWQGDEKICVGEVGHQLTMFYAYMFSSAHTARAQPSALKCCTIYTPPSLDTPLLLATPPLHTPSPPTYTYPTPLPTFAGRGLGACTPRPRHYGPPRKLLHKPLHLRAAPCAAAVRMPAPRAAALPVPAEPDAAAPQRALHGQRLRRDGAEHERQLRRGERSEPATQRGTAAAAQVCV